MNNFTNLLIRNQHITGWTIILILYFEVRYSRLENIISKITNKSMKIEVLDQKFLQSSENQFKFGNSIYNVSIPENSMGKTYVSTSPYEDRLGISITRMIDVKYKIVSGDQDKLFKAEERIIGNFAFLTIRTRTTEVVLNREKTDQYHLIVRAVISSQNLRNDTFEAETVVHVRVLDRNDLSPLFYPTEYEEIVPEDTPIHKSIIAVTAEDADLGINGEIYYSFLDDNDYFAIHPTSGVISLIRQLKYSEKSVFELTAFATDRASAINHKNSQGSKAKIIIRVEQVNYHPPEILVNVLYGTAENSNTNIYGIVKVTDKDRGCHGDIKKLEIIGGDPDGHFSIKQSTLLREYFIEINRLAVTQIHKNGYNLTLRAEDKGIPALSSYKVVPIHIFLNSDSIPIFTKELYEVSVSEASPVNTPVIRLRATDPNFEKNALVFLEIVGGNEGGEFRINPDSGMLYTQKLLDAEYKSFYTLTVSAVDQANVGIRKQSSAKIKINIEDVNDNDPIFNLVNTTIITYENALAGTVVLKLTAKDMDSGENSYISYSIANLNEVPFEIDHFTGVLRTTVIIDFETMRREYLLSIRASDWGQPYRRQTELELTIKIRDINDNRPQFERIGCVGKVLRNIPVGTDIFTLSSIDFDSGDFITYRLMSGNDDGCFNLDPVSGVLSVACDLNNMAISNRIINISSTDGMHFSDEMSIQMNFINMVEKQINSPNSVNLANDYGSFECRETGVARQQAEILAIAERNNVEVSKKLVNLALMPSRYGENLHTPDFIDFPRELVLNESVQLGETVVWIRGTDRDLGYNGKLTFTISDGDTDSVFRIDSDTGELQVIGYLDRERQDQYLLNITVYDLGQPQKFKSKVLPVNILDINDNPPVFQKALACFHLTENAINGTIVFNLRATDADLGENGYVTYAMMTDTRDFFLDPLSGVLYIVKPLDRELIDEYELHIIAKDTGIPSLASEAIIKIFVEDINDNAPKFSMAQFLYKIREDIPLRTVVSSVQAIDLDLGTNAEIYYSFEEDIANYALFTIDKYTGIIRTKGFLDYETRQTHNLIVSAIDLGTPSLTSNITVVIEVLDVNENQFAPEFTDFVFVASVMENKPKDTFVMNITAVDADASGIDSTISYSIRGGDGMGIFAVSNIGAIRTLFELDAEVKNHYWLTLCAQDQAIIPLWSCVQIFVTVNNVNDNVPLTDKPVYYPSVMEGSPSGVFIFQLMAEDEDKDASNIITYKIISGNPEGFFVLDAFSGVLSTTARKLDRENQSEHILEVSVADNGYPVLSSTTRIVINVDDINDHGPEFDQGFYKVQAPSTLGVNSSLIQVLAFDNDIGENGRITYIIKSGKGKSKCRIDSKTGMVYATKKLNPGSEFELNIRAEDNGNPKRSQMARLNVMIIPIAKSSVHTPIIKSLDLHVDVTESDRPGFLVTLIQASDKDGDHLWYNLDGDDRNEFYIGRDNGNILLSKSLDREVQQTYNLTVSVSDGINVIRTQLYVNVIDINDNRPQFTKDVYEIDVSEDIEEESIILRLQAMDLDEDKKIFYTLHAARDPSSLSLFRIDSFTGNVLTVHRVDREKASEHILIVTAKDQGTPANRNYAKIIIKVCDHNDHYPEFSLKIVQSNVLESSEIGSKVVQMFALDQDYGRNAEIKYSIVSGNIGNSFEIDSTMGLVTVGKSLNMNQVQEYMLQIKANDLGNPMLSSQIPLHIIITVAEHDPPKFVSSYILVEIFENIPIGTYVTKIDALSSSSVFYEILDDILNEFQINPAAGVIVTKEKLDYEIKRSYNLTIRATNMASASSNTYVLIHVLDVNDNAPFFVENKYFGEISEAAEIGSLVLKSTGTNRPLLLTTSDFDTGVNGMTEFNILDDIAQQYFSIDPSTGAVKIKSSLDYERIPDFKFNVVVSDSGSPKLFGRIPAEVLIHVKNTNDCPPLFTENRRNITLYHPTYANIFVTQVNASDADIDESVEIRYDIIDGNSASTFAIDSKTGVISTRNVEKLESAYILHVRASDGVFSTITQIYISIEQSETCDLIFQKSVYEFTVIENSTKIFTIGLVNVLGTNLNEQVEYRILNSTNMFKIGITSGVIETTGKVFDRELQENYKLILEAKSSVFHENAKYVRRAHAMANIEIADINDNCPLFVNLPYYAIVSVDDLKGCVIIKVQAIDLDTFENGDVRYEMKKGNGELFRVDRKTGEVSLRQSLEGHNRNYELVIAAYDGAVLPCSTEVIVYVKVVDKSVPIFSRQFYSYIVNENTEIYSTLFISVQAESPLRGKLIYTITEGNDDETFDIDFITGVICVVNKLDYEKRKNYELVVRATDNVSGISADVPVSIQIEDSNDCYPKIEKDTYKVTIIENAILGTQVLKISAQDNDTSMNGDLSYFIEHHNGNNKSDFFHIDITEGIIYLKQSIDYESIRLHHLVVVVMDHGTPSLSSRANVWITVMDINDNPPRFIDPSFTSKLSMLAVRGQFVTIIKAYDLDKTDALNLMYNIVNGNELQKYAIDRTSGVITVHNIQNLYKSKISLLNVSVTDGVFTSYARVKITLLPENINTPIFSQLIYEANIKENSMPGTRLLNVTAKDADFGDYSKLSYDISTADMKEYFTVGKHNGIVETKKVFDREKRSEYELLVRATDGGGKYGFATVKIKIDDVNDNAPLFMLKEYRTTVKVDINLNSAVLKVRAVDLDEHQNKIVKYYIYNETLDPLFMETIRINEVNGELFIIKSVTELTNKLLKFFVRAYDNGNPQLYSEVPISIRFVSPDTDVPILENKNRNLFVPESTSPGTVLIKLHYSGNFTLKYSIPTESPYFSLSDNAELLLMETLDREETDLHIIFVIAETITTPRLYLMTELNIHVQDENDNNPIFVSNSYSITIAENVNKMASILKVSAKDSDSGSNGDIRYYFADDAYDVSNIFDIDIYSGWVTTLTSLDRENQSVYKFHIIAADNGQQRRVTKVPVEIKLEDYNDNPPYFKKQLNEITLEENALPGTVLLHPSLLDIDEKKNDVDFFIIDGDIYSQFHIGQTGEVFVTNGLDREEKAFYNLSLLATDGKFIAKTLVHVFIRDVNDNIPYCLLPKYELFINESLAIGTPITKIVAIDSDENGTEILRYYLTGTGSDNFSIDKGMGILKIAKIIDREIQPKYMIFVHVQDGLHLQWECISEIVIIVNDLNDNKPEFSMQQYVVSIPEDAQVGSVVAKIHASDKDIGLNRKILYSFIATEEHFNISRENGIVTLTKELDRENVSTFNISVRSEDCGTPKLFMTSTLLINVLDINDNPPEFTLKHYVASISEKTEFQTVVIRVSATSKDTGVNAEISYFIVGGNEQKRFFIDINTGVVFVNGILDYEKTKEYFLTIQAVDGGAPPLSNIATLNISILDINDNEPKFMQNSYRIKVKEDINIREKILQVIAIDEDSGQNSVITYNIESGDRLNQFSVDEQSGNIFTVSLLDREFISNYLLEVQACDIGIPKLCSYINIHVDILDANDNPPLFVQNNFKVVVQENRDLGYVLLKFDISDADEFPNTSPYTFDFRSGNERGFFRLEQDGTLRTAGRFNHKVRDSYQLQIRVFDNGTPPLFSDAWIHIKVIEESQYPPVITPLEITVHSYEDEFVGGFLGRVFATDQDQYDTFHYDLSTVLGQKFLPNSLFNISHDNGNIFAVSNLDVGVYKLNATVTDGKFLSSGMVRINVELINADMVQHAVAVKFRNVTPENFILSHRKGFIRSIRSVMRCRQKDVIIISIQTSINDINDIKHLRNNRSLRKSLSSNGKPENNLDILFTVRKQQVNPVLKGYFTIDEIRSTVVDNVEEIEETTSLSVKEVFPIVCSMMECVNGKCKYKIMLNKFVTTTFTDVVSFVLPNYNRIKECQCKQGFDGKSCEEVVDACFSDPCLPHKLCLPSKSFEGYQCICPQGYYGHFCEHESWKCENSTCDNSFSSVSFGGKSYAHYRINQSSAKSVIENQFAMFMKVRTFQHTGTLMFACGKVDYNILEISNGAVQYKFDLGSGEGFVSVSSVFVSDGEWHIISLDRILNSAKLIVDNKHISQGSAPGMNGILNLQSYDIFIGAEVRPHPSIVGHEDIQRGFVGCLGEVRISTELLPLYISSESAIASLKRFTNVEFMCNPSSVAVVQLGVCEAQPCINGGVCIDLGNGHFKCHCHVRFTGKFCQFDLDPCTSSPCLYGAECSTDTFGNYSCNCARNLSGRRCEFGKFCDPNPCKNGGICEEGDGVPHCICRGYTGMECEIDVNECENEPCGNGATCINESGSFRCICPSYLTGANCGDPLYSNSISIKLKNISLEHITGIIFGVAVVLIFLTIGLCIIVCRRRNKKEKSNKKKERYKEDNLNTLLAKDDNKYNSKLSNLDVNQRPINYTSTTNENNFATNATFMNNLDVLRSYGSAGDELENIPVEYQKINRTNQEININAYTNGDTEIVKKQTWSDQLQMTTFSENKLNNERSNEANYSNLTSLKTNKFSSGKLIHVAMPNVCHMQHLVEISPNSHGKYHWDCSDWVRESQNLLPDITEVPSAEIVDSISFHSNESNESKARVQDLVRNIGVVDPMSDISTLKEEIVSDKEPSCQPLSLSLERTFSISRLSPSNQSKNEDYKTNSGSSEEMFLLYPKNYNRESNSDMSVQLCEIEDSELDEFLPPGPNNNP